MDANIALGRDIRMCVDLCHRDGVIKDIVMKDPASFIIYDENIVPLLKKLRRAGKKVFLLTNSMYEYTNRVMDFLVHGAGHHQDIEWKSLFDCIIVGACKPAFMIDNYLSLFHVQE
jgi:5'-nucleotidase